MTQNQLFNSPHSEYSSRNGQSFEIVRKIPGQYLIEGKDDNMGDTYIIRFDDGTEITAWPEEIFATSGIGTVGNPIQVVQ